MIILHDREIKFDGPLRRKVSNDRFYVEFMSEVALENFEDFQIEKEKDGWIVHFSDETTKQAFMQRIVEVGASLKKFYPQEETLEQFVKEVTNR